MKNLEAKKRFLVWLKENEPYVFEVAKRANYLDDSPASMAGLSGVDWGGIFSKVGDVMQTAAPKFLQYKAQKNLIKMQRRRAEQGLPPANIDDYAPVIKVAPQITPEAEQAIQRAAVATVKKSGVNKTVMYVGGGLLALLGLKFAGVIGKKR